MIRFARLLPLAAVIAGIVMFGTAGPARASIELVLTDVSTSSTVNGTPISSNAAMYSGAVGNFSVDISVGSSNSPGTNYRGITQEGTVQITNNGSTTETLSILVSANGFTSPMSPPPLYVTDTVSGSVASGTMSGTAQGFTSYSNNLGAEDFASSLLTFGPTPGGQSFSQNGSVYGFSPTSAYSMTFVETFTLSAGGTITLTGGNVETIMPEPSSMMAALAAMPFLAMGAWLRRRKQVAIA
jgi:hypothetical protein